MSGEKEETVPDQWMVRPCAIYEEEYKHCKGFRARAHQKFVYGQKLNCQKWYDDWVACTNYVKTDDPKHLTQVIENERERRRRRLKAAAANTVWEYRDSPPETWTNPLPEDLRLRQSQSANEFIKYETTSTAGKSPKGSCSIQ